MSAPAVLIVERVCPWCEGWTWIQVEREAYDAWQAGMLIQRAFPHLTPDQRELIKTGLHAECLKQICPDDDD